MLLVLELLDATDELVLTELATLLELGTLLLTELELLLLIELELLLTLELLAALSAGTVPEKPLLFSVVKARIKVPFCTTTLEGSKST